MSGAEILVLINVGVALITRIGGRLIERWREAHAIPVGWQLTLLVALLVVMGTAFVRRTWLRVALQWAAVGLAIAAAVQCGAFERFGVGLYRWFN